MAPRKTASTTIALGLERIPVAIYPATIESPSISLATICRKHNAKVEQRWACSKKGETVKRDKTIKGYQLAEGRFLPLTPEEYEKLIPKPEPEIIIQEVCELRDMDIRRFTGRFQHLGPDAGTGPIRDTKALWDFAKLLRGLEEGSEGEGAMAIGRWLARGADKVAGIFPWEGRLVLAEMRRPSEVRDITEIEAAEEPRSEDVDQVIPILKRLETPAALAGAFPDEKYEATVKLLQAKAEEAANAPASKKRAAR